MIIIIIIIIFLILPECVFPLFCLFLPVSLLPLQHFAHPFPTNSCSLPLLLLLSSANSPPLISRSLVAPPHFLLFPSLYLCCCSPVPLSVSITERRLALFFFFFLSFIAFLPDNSPVLTGWSYYPLYGTSMLRGFYEILVPVDKMMELLSAVIPSRITASVGKYTTPWIIDRAVAALLLTNSWPVLKGPQNPEEYIG